nr:MAG: replication initiator protein [Microvirus sp.]
MLVSSLVALIGRAMQSPNYTRHGWGIHEWDISGSCSKPMTRELHARPLILGRVFNGGPSNRPYSLILHTRCRMCQQCLQLRSSEWRYRATSEMRESARTWFGTLTLRPEEHHKMVSRARQRLWSGGTDFDALSPHEQFMERMTEIGREVTLYLKRVRKESGARVRYLLVAEAHKTGLPHLHILVHEASPDKPVRHKTLEGQWKLGFTRFKLAHDVKTASYVCKYISKALLARVRASLRYGQGEAERPKGIQSAGCSREGGKMPPKEAMESNDIGRNNDIGAEGSKTEAVRYGRSLTDLFETRRDNHVLLPRGPTRCVEAGSVEGLSASEEPNAISNTATTSGKRQFSATCERQSQGCASLADACPVCFPALRIFAA